MTRPLHLELPYRVRRDVDWFRNSEAVRIHRARFL